MESTMIGDFMHIGLTLSMRETRGGGLLRKGCVISPTWSCNWRFGNHRLGDSVLPGVFMFDTIELDEPYRRQGHLSSLLRRMIEDQEIGGQPFRYIGFWNCGDHLMDCLRKLGFEIHSPQWLRQAWRQVEQRDLFDPIVIRQKAVATR